MDDKLKISKLLNLLKEGFDGEIFVDKSIRLMYATDASAYREVPFAVCYPATEDDISKLVKFSSENRIPLVPRGAGTSLAGQVVGNGIVVDISKHFTAILEINKEERYARVQPGVVRDELNRVLEPYGLFFAPETSTSNRCMIAGMVGNNACGAHSLVYGSTRDHTLELKTVLSDGSRAVFGAVDKKGFFEKTLRNTLEGEIYRETYRILSDKSLRNEIKKEFPHPDIRRRNNGYSLDELMDCEIFGESDKPFNFCKLLAGSEGTLAFTTEIKLNLEPLPPKHIALVAVHLNTVAEALKANLIALEFKPFSVELTDKILLDLTKKISNKEKTAFLLRETPVPF